MGNGQKRELPVVSWPETGGQNYVNSIPMKPFPYQPTSPIHKFDYAYDTPSLVSRTIGHRPDKKVAQP